MSDRTQDRIDYGPDSIKLISAVEAIRRRPELYVGAPGPERALICVAGVLRAFHLASGFSRPAARIKVDLRVKGQGRTLSVDLWSPADVDAEWFALLRDNFEQLQAGYEPNGLGNGLVVANAFCETLWAAAVTPRGRVDLYGAPELAAPTPTSGTGFHACMTFAPEAGSEGLTADLLRGYVLSESHRYPGSSLTEFSYEQ